VPYLTSTTALDLEALPRSLLVIGGGYIGAELAQMFARAGVKVTLVCRSRLLPEAEPEIGAALTGYFEDEGITVISGIAYRAIRKTEGRASLTVTRDGHDVQIDADQVLITTGRTPNIEGLGLAEHGITVSAKGGIVVDDRMRTTKIWRLCRRRRHRPRPVRLHGRLWRQARRQERPQWRQPALR
jgi:mercuric reductase